MTDESDRGTGRTTRQMIAAPLDAIYISCHAYTKAYDVHLARKIGREDLEIVDPSWLDHGWHRKVFTGILVDHAALLSPKEQELLCGARTRIRNGDGND